MLSVWCLFSRSFHVSMYRLVLPLYLPGLPPCVYQDSGELLRCSLLKTQNIVIKWVKAVKLCVTPWHRECCLWGYSGAMDIGQWWCVCSLMGKRNRWICILGVTLAMHGTYGKEALSKTTGSVGEQGWSQWSAEDDLPPTWKSSGIRRNSSATGQHSSSPRGGTGGACTHTCLPSETVLVNQSKSNHILLRKTSGCREWLFRVKHYLCTCEAGDWATSHTQFYFSFILLIFKQISVNYSSWPWTCFVVQLGPDLKIILPHGLSNWESRPQPPSSEINPGSKRLLLFVYWCTHPWLQRALMMAELDGKSRKY